MKTVCPNCEQTIERNWVPGQNIPCPVCGHVFRIPRHESASVRPAGSWLLPKRGPAMPVGGWLTLLALGAGGVLFFRPELTTWLRPSPRPLTAPTPTTRAEALAPRAQATVVAPESIILPPPAPTEPTSTLAPVPTPATTRRELASPEMWKRPSLEPPPAAITRVDVTPGRTVIARPAALTTDKRRKSQVPAGVRTLEKSPPGVPEKPAGKRVR